MSLLIQIFYEAWQLLVKSSPYIIFGLFVSGLLHIFLNPNVVAKHLGKGKIKSVLKAALIGIPIPLCSCGVLPAAVSIKKQGANKGATTAFLISTPESGVDSISITYALLDPILTIARPLAAFVMAAIAGITENLTGSAESDASQPPDLSCTVDGCCDGIDCDPAEHRHHHTLSEKVIAGTKFAFTDVWGDMANWFFAGLLIAGIISALVPETVIAQYLGGGLISMLIMLAMGVPLYVCASASTPIAAALILKGVSPGAALVFLLTGPATNITSLTVLFGILGKKTTAIYLSTIVVVSLVFGLALDSIYHTLGISPTAIIGNATEVIPIWIQYVSTFILLAVFLKLNINKLFTKKAKSHNHDDQHLKPINDTSCKAPT